jgi:NADH-quinone oxidoreductase subunit A
MELWPLALYFVAVLVIVSTMLLLSYFLGERHSEVATPQPYESGILPTGSARIRLDPSFYLIAMFFVVFDVEVLFILAWAIALREAGWTGYLEMLVFVGVLLLSLAYLWRIGALSWGPRRAKRLDQEKPWTFS